MTNRYDRRNSIRTRHRPRPEELAPRRAGRRLLVLIAVAALVVLAIASAGSAITAAPDQSPSPSAAAVLRA